MSPDHPTRPDIDLLDGHFYGNDPHPQFTWMRANAPVYFDQANGIWGITRYGDLKAVAADPSTFSNAQGIRPDNGPLPMMIDMDDPDHLRRRKLVNKGFTPRRVRESEDRIRLVCDSILDAVCETGSCDLVRDVAAPLPMIMIGDALGVAPEDRADLLRWSEDMVGGLSGVSSSEEAMIRAANAFSEYEAYSGRVIAQRRGCPGTDDLMGILVDAEVDGDRLDDAELNMESLLILIGGDETTRHVISGGVGQLLAHPDQRDRLAADPALMPGAVEEMLRWVSPIRNMARVVTHDVEFARPVAARGPEAAAAVPLGQPRRGRVRRPVPVRHRADAQRTRGLRVRRPLLSGRQPGPPGDHGHGRTHPDPHARPGPGRGDPAAGGQLHQWLRIDAGDLQPHGPRRRWRRLIIRPA